jgi:hypothetical protein
MGVIRSNDVVGTSQDVSQQRPLLNPDQRSQARLAFLIRVERCDLRT